MRDEYNEDEYKPKKRSYQQNSESMTSREGDDEGKPRARMVPCSPLCSPTAFLMLRACDHGGIPEGRKARGADPSWPVSLLQNHIMYMDA